MVQKNGILLVMLILSVMTVPALLGVAQPTEQEARQKFEALGCIACHNGGVAPTWDQIIQLFQDWKNKYGSLDEAVANEVNFFGQKFNTYDEMMAEMARSSAANTPDNPDFQVIYEYLKSVFEGQAAAPAEQPQEEAPAQEETAQQPAEEAPAEEAPAEEAKGPVLSFGQIAGLAIVLLVIIVGIAYFIARK